MFAIYKQHGGSIGRGVSLSGDKYVYALLDWGTAGRVQATNNALTNVINNVEGQINNLIQMLVLEAAI